MMFAQRFVASFRRPFGFAQGREKRSRLASIRGRSGQMVDPDKIGVDIVSEQVKKMLQTSDQKLILMVRG